MKSVRPAKAKTSLRICLPLECYMTGKLLAEHHLEFLSLTGGCTDSSEPTLVKIPHCWRSCDVAHLQFANKD